MRVLAEGEQAQQWPSGIDVVEGSITRPAEAPTAFENIQALFLAHPDPSTTYDALRLAKAGGATKVVNLSSHGPDIEIAFPPDSWHWLAIEVLVERSGMAWCHIVPSLIMASTLTQSYPLVGKSWRDLIRRGEPIKRAFPQAKVPFIHENDLAAVIAQVLRRPECNGKKIYASGTPISDQERIQILRDVLHTPIRFEELSREQAVTYYHEHGLADEAIAYVLDLAEWFTEHTDEASTEVERLLGRPLTTYAEWVREHRAEFS